MREAFSGLIVLPSEVEILRQSLSTARSWIDLSQITNFPEDVTGLRTLDIGGGGSNLTATLLEMGADAYAVDPRYGNVSIISQSLEQNLRRLKRIHQGTSAWPKWRSYIEASEQALRMFLRSFRANPERYLAQSALKLGFDDDSFDLVTSYDCITRNLDLNGTLFERAVREALRVTKVGKRVEIFPFAEQYLPVPPIPQYNLEYSVRTQNQQSLLAALKRNSAVTYEILSAGRSVNKKLAITKLA